MVSAHAAAETYYVAVSSTSELNVREQPSKDAEVITVKLRGDTLETTGKTDGLWVEVYTDSYTYIYRDGQEVEEIGPLNGWVQITYLSEEKPYSGVQGTIVGAGKTCFRSEPRIDEDTEKGWIQAGDTVTVLSVFNYGEERWYRVQNDGERGFMVADYVAVAT